MVQPGHDALGAKSRHVSRWLVLLPLFVGLLLLIGWQVVHAQPPAPNPLPSAKDVDVTANGPAPSIHGDPLRGRAVFSANCASCHGDRGVGGVANPGSDDGTVPSLNPIDPGFVEDSHGDAGIFARDIDLFLQHGSEPAGDDPGLKMPAWGDLKLLSQQQLADVEAYVMQLNGVYWPDRWYPPAEVQMSAARSGSTVTYTINIFNEGGSALGEVLLRDTLPSGSAFISSDYFGQGNNPAKVDGSTVEWSVADIPQGGSAGPFRIVTGFTGSAPAPNTAQVLFTFCTWDGNCLPASQVSNPVSPAQPVVAKPTPPRSAPVVVALPSPTAQPAATEQATPTESATESTPVSQATEAPTEVPATPTPPPTAMPAQALRPSNGNLTAGPALNLTGDPGNGGTLFAQKCKGCHGDQGVGGVNNPGSNDGTVPALNPVNPLLKSADAKTFAYNLDLFMEHGSKPAGTNPLVTMPAWGDTQLLTPQQIADLIAYVISLNP